jgi:hypothetical protein
VDGTGAGWYPGASFVTRAFSFHVWSVMSSCEVSTNIGYLVTSSDDSIAREIGNMECDIGMSPGGGGGALCLCKLPGILRVNKNYCIKQQVNLITCNV